MTKEINFEDSTYLKSILEADKVVLYLLWAHFPIVGFIIPLGYGTVKESAIMSFITCIVGTISYIFSKSTYFHRLLNGALLITFSAIMINAQYGRIEMHFHIFGVMAFMLIYKDWKIYAPLTLLVALHHAGFNYCQTQGIELLGSSIRVFNYGSGWNIVGLHAIMVIFENSILSYYAYVFKKQFINLTSSVNLSAMGEMAGGIAHEINNPLAIMLMNIDLLKRMNNKGEISKEILDKKLNLISETINRIGRIISGLKTVSRDTNDEDCIQCNFREIFKDALVFSTEKLKSNGVKLFIPWENEHLDQNIFACRVQLSQILINLLNNSYDAICELDEKWIKIEISKNHDFMIIEFIDSGFGIPPKIQNKMFNPFYTTKEIGKGTGLGLSLCKAILQKHNGNFFVNNNHKHTCFTIEIPYLKENIEKLDYKDIA